MDIPNLTIIGSSHISHDSARQIRESMDSFLPDIVAVELDKNRLYALTHKQDDSIKFSLVRQIGITGFVFMLIGRYVQKKLAKVVDSKPGVDMLCAIDEAKTRGLIVALIDQDIQITLKRLSAKITFREKMNFLADIIKGIFMPKRQIKKLGLGEFDLSKVPGQEMIEKLLHSLKGRYPNLYMVLVHERNHFMANSIHSISKTFPDKKILAVVGAGHLKEIEKILAGKLRENI